MVRSDRNAERRREAWAYGRALISRLLNKYREEYGEEVPPAPALIADELITDFLGAVLRFDPLSKDLFAQTDWVDGKAVVTINSLTATIDRVKDASGVQNVAKLHEAVHVDRDLHLLRTGQTLPLPGFDAPSRIKCYRKTSPRWATRGSEWVREFWAEEAGRAAAVDHSALARSDAFRSFASVNTLIPNGQRWSLLYEAASDIGINISALVTQLELEGRIVIETQEGRKVVHVQPGMHKVIGDA